MLTDSEIDLIINWASEQDDLIMIGGQAVAIWQEYYGDSGNFETEDIDFIGGLESAPILAESLNAKIKIPSLDDHTPNTAIIYRENGEVLVDFIDHIAGISSLDAKNRVIAVIHKGRSINILHPVDCLESKLYNFLHIKSKNTHDGNEQLKTSIRICKSFLLGELNKNREKSVRKLSSRIFDMASSADGKRLFHSYNIDLINAIPEEKHFKSQEYKNKDLPKKIKKINTLRKKYADFLSRKT